MASRIELHEELCNLLGSRNVYFQPPDSVKMKYPAIRYELSGFNKKKANNHIYAGTNKYDVIIIDHNPDSTIWKDVVNHFSMCNFEQSYPANDLNHFKLTIFY